MVKAGNHTINPYYVTSCFLDPGYDGRATTLTVYMADGRQILIEHRSHGYNPVNCYDIQAAIEAAMGKPLPLEQRGGQ